MGDIGRRNDELTDKTQFAAPARIPESHRTLHAWKTAASTASPSRIRPRGIARGPASTSGQVDRGDLYACQKATTRWRRLKGARSSVQGRSDRRKLTTWRIVPQAHDPAALHRHTVIPDASFSRTTDNGARLSGAPGSAALQFFRTDCDYRAGHAIRASNCEPRNERHC